MKTPILDVNGLPHCLLKHKDFVNFQKCVYPEMLRPPELETLDK